MASILDFLDSEEGKKFVSRSSKEVEENPEKVRSALAMALPMMLGAMKKNSRTDDGAENLNNALENKKHDGSILSSMSENFNGGKLISEGSGIMNHIFGGKQNKIEQAIGSSAAMDPNKVSQLLKMAAPVILGILGSQKRKDQVGKKGISNLLSSVMGSNSSHDQSLLETLLDASSDDNIVTETAGKLFGNKDRSKGLGDFFKG